MGNQKRQNTCPWKGMAARALREAGDEFRRTGALMQNCCTLRVFEGIRVLPHGAEIDGSEPWRNCDGSTSQAETWGQGYCGQLQRGEAIISME